MVEKTHEAINMPWEDERARVFVSDIGIISSNGKYGYNLMSCEWTHQISYNPARISISVNKESATLENIMERKYFGVNILEEKQALVSSICGNISGKDVDKISVIKALGYEFEKAKYIDVLLLRDALFNAEWKVINILDIGDHVLFIGDIIEAKRRNGAPLIYHAASYWKIGEKLSRPSKEEVDKINAIIEKFKKN
ncbi:MAG: flavin reductase family protein [Candidatus Anstonellales archaeon]